ncbi:MAG: beta-propeller domain-containing protein [Granulosicoccus sp.]
MFTRALLVAVSISMLWLSACSDGENSEPETSGESGNSALESRLKPLGADEFYSALQDSLLNQYSQQYAGSTIDGDFDVAVPVFAPEVDSALANESTESGESGSDGLQTTTTNLQESGVDEQDRVKLSGDGSRLYVLGSAFDQSSSVPQVEVSAATSSLPAPGSFQTVLRIMSLDPETPDASVLAETTLAMQGRQASGFYLFEDGSEISVIVASTGEGYWNSWSVPYYFAGLSSVITKVDVSNPDVIGEEEAFELDGQIVSSRRIGNYLFFASRYSPAIPVDRPWEMTTEQLQQTIDEDDELASLLPSYTRIDTQQATPLVDASKCFVANRGADQAHYTPDIITLGVIDLKTMELSDAECFLGSTETLYASVDAVFLATTQYDYSEGPQTTSGMPVDTDDMLVIDVDETWFDPRVSTDIHQFDIADGSLGYTGSGTVKGHLGWNPERMPFRMSYHNGSLRVATMNDRQGGDASPILMHVLRADEQGNLNIVSSLPNETEDAPIGKPGERLYASRFLGDRAYLVTFRQTDPLYVIDLADVENPSVLGELEIQGFSDYLHPVDENYLFGLGFDAVASLDQGADRGALVQGMKLSLFDVSNPAAPTEIESVLIGQRGTNSVATSNHRAITVQPANEFHPLRVSFGVNVHGEAQPTTSPSQSDAIRYYDWSYTGLHGYEIQTGANAGIFPQGVLIVDSVNSGRDPYGRFGDDRSVMVGNALFYIHGSDVYAANWDNLAASSDAR